MLFHELIQFLRTNDRFLLVSHADPDGDALGSEFALYHVLKSLRKEVQILNADQASEKFAFFDQEKVIHSLEEGWPIPEDLHQLNLLLLDTSDTHHTGKAQEVLIPKAKTVTIIDHHTLPTEARYPAFVDESAAATCQIVYEIMEALGVSLEYSMALAMFLGIVYDTGSFIYPKTSPRTFEIAMKLTQAGVKPKEIHSNLYETIEPSRMKLLAQVQSTMKLLRQDTVAFQKVTQAMLVDSGATLDDSDNFINYPLKCTDVLVSVLMKELPTGRFRCSLRSKGTIDISKVAMDYGGGGHRNAAGFPVPDLALDQFLEILLKLLHQKIIEGSV